MDFDGLRLSKAIQDGRSDGLAGREEARGFPAGEATEFDL